MSLHKSCESRLHDVEASERCLDLLFCLAVLQADAPHSGPVLDVYSNLLRTLADLRKDAGPGWTQAATSEQVGEQAAAALSWIFSSCACKLNPVALPEDWATSAELFLVSPGPPEREQRFQELRRAHGSAFAFHGSGPENWASILRHGLRNLSMTERMRHGAVQGCGVYLSPNPRVAAMYSGLGATAKSDRSGHVAQPGEPELVSCDVRTNAAPRALPDIHSIRVVGICEVALVPAPGLQRNTETAVASRVAPAWVAAEDGIVAVRGLLVFPEPTRGHIPTAETLAALLAAAETKPSHTLSDSARRKPKFPVASVNLLRPAWFPNQKCTRGYHAFQIEAKRGQCVWRRYSDFENLRLRVGDGPRASFPERQSLRNLFFGLTEDGLELRRQGLERWLREVIMAAQRGLIRDELHPELCAFLGAWNSD